MEDFLRTQDSHCEFQDDAIGLCGFYGTPSRVMDALVTYFIESNIWRKARDMRTIYTVL